MRMVHQKHLHIQDPTSGLHQLHKIFSLSPCQLLVHTIVDLKLFEMAVKAYKEKGSPKHFLDSQELTNEQRSELYDKVIYSEKGRYPKNNPYKTNG